MSASIYLDEVTYSRPGPTTSSTCGGISTRWSFGMEVGRGNSNGLCVTNEKVGSLLYRGGGSFRNVDTPTLWLDKGGQRTIAVGGYGFLYLRITCGCKVLVDIGAGVKGTSLLIVEGELPESITITNDNARDIEVELGILRDPI